MNPTSLALDCITRTIRSIEIHAAHVSLALAPKATLALAQGDVVAQISARTRTDLASDRKSLCRVKSRQH
jgi:hypothetical protein